jgi:ParB/RepB/Spo0J family partition protein
MDSETFAALVEDMRVGGMFAIKPIDVFPVGLDDRGLVKLQISDGHNRTRAAKQLSWKRIRAEVVSITENEAKVLNYRRNRERGNFNPIKEAELFFGLWDKGKGKLTQEEIAEKYGVSQAHVSLRLGLLKMPPTVQEVVKTGELPSSHAEEILHRNIPAGAEAAVARVAVAEKLTPDQTRQVAERIQEDIQAEPSAPPALIQARAEHHAKQAKKGSEKPDHDDVKAYLGQLRSDANRAFSRMLDVLEELARHKEIKSAPQEEVDEVYNHVVSLLNGAIARLPKKYKASLKLE